MDGQPPAVLVIGQMEKLLEDLRVEDRDQKIEAGVVVGDQREQRHLLFTQTGQIQFVRGSQTGETFQIEFFQPGGKGDLDAFQRFGAAAVVVLVILHRDMIRVSHLQALKQLVQRGLISVVIFAHIGGAQHFHDHGEVLLIGWSFIVEIEHQGQKQHGGRRVPEGIVGLAALGGRALKEVGHQTLHIVIVPEIDEGVITVAALHVQQIQHPHFIALLLQQITGIPDQLALRIEDHKAGVGLAEIRFCVKSRLARAAAAHDHGVEVAAVLSAVQPHTHALGKELVGLRLFGPVLLVNGLSVAPFSRAVFLPAPVVMPGGEIDTEAHSICEQKKEDSFEAVLAKLDMGRVIHRLCEPGEDLRQAAGRGGRDQ